MSIRALFQHARQCRELRGLLRRYDSPRIRALHWYGLPLHQAVSWRGILRVALWNLFRRQQDAIAGNYDVVNLYYAEPEEDGRERPAPTVWHCRGLETRPFWDEDSPTRRTLEAHAKTIAEEFRKLRDRMQVHPDNASLMLQGLWTGLFLFQASGARNDAVCGLCPETARIVESLPLCRNFGFVMFSGMEPGSHVEPHTGSSNLRLRHHLGVEVPETGTVRLRVGTEWRSWAQDRCLVFDDSYQHEVLHEGRLPRFVLVVDVWHPALGERDVEFLSQPIFQRFGKLAAGA